MPLKKLLIDIVNVFEKESDVGHPVICTKRFTSLFMIFLLNLSSILHDQ